MARITGACGNCAKYVFGGADALDVGPLPLVDDDEHAEEGRGIEKEDGARVIGCHNQAAQGGSDGAGKVEAGTIESDSLRDHTFADQFGDYGLPGRSVEGRTQAKHESEQEEDSSGQQVEGGEHAESDSYEEHPALANEKQFAAVDDVGDRAGREADQEDGQAGGGLHESNEDGRGREDGHQPGGTDVLHPRAEVGGYRGDPEPAKYGHAERSPLRSGDGCAFVGRVSDWCFESCAGRKGAPRKSSVEVSGSSGSGTSAG